jgi:hypothetical protein
MIQELLLFGGFLIHFDIAGLNLPLGFGIPRQNFHSSDAFCIPNCCMVRRKSANFVPASWEGEQKNPPDGNDPRISKLKCSLPRRQNYFLYI